MKGKLLKGLSVFLFLFGLLICMQVRVFAADDMTDIKEIHVGETGYVKSGDYYFSWDGKDGRIMMGKSKTGMNQSTPLPDTFYSSGIRAYYMNSSATKIYSYRYSTRVKGTVLDLKNYLKTDVYETVCDLIGGCGNYLFISIYQAPKSGSLIKKTLRVDIRDKSVATASSGSMALTVHNGYAVTTTQIAFDVSSRPLTLKKISSSGKFSTILKLTNRGFSPTFIGSRLYYASYPYVDSYGGTNYKISYLYKTDMEGNKEKIASFKMKNKDEVYVTGITSRYCMVYTSSGVLYKYDYESKSLKKV